MQAENDDDLYGDQRSSEVKCGNLCAMATMERQVKHRKLCYMAIKLGQINC